MYNSKKMLSPSDGKQVASGHPEIESKPVYLVDKCY